MATTLVIKNASFATNKVDTVTFIENIPCTGISLSVNSLSFTSYGETKTIGYTLTPANTTDAVNIISSNTNVVTISGNNVSAIGVGTATITVTCGNQTATVSVTSTMTMDRYFKSGYLAQKKTGGSVTTYAVESEAGNWGYCGAETAWGNGRYIAVSQTPYIPVYRIPKNCASLDIKVPSGWKTLVMFFDSTRSGGSLDSGAYLVSGEVIADAVIGDRTISVPEGADSVGISYRTTASSFAESSLTGYEVTFVAAA